MALYSLDKAYAPLYYGLTPINGNVLYASLLSLLLYFMMSLFVEQLRAAFMFFACFGHLKLNLSVYDSPPASSSLCCSASPVKDEAALLLWELAAQTSD